MFTDRITTIIFYLLFILLALGVVVNLRAQNASETPAGDSGLKVERLYDVILLIDGIRQHAPN